MICTCDSRVCKQTRTKRQILRQALVEILENTPGAYTASITFKLRGRR